ncbi:MAG TPA: hypothetical protein VGY55_12990 [Pirellulales bacterium]|jgi:hypothetical protein|nr:hypothetical protein [Pirellulales bacterium]
MASINSITFDLSDCSLREQSEGHRGWMNSLQVAQKLQFQPGPPEWPFDLTNPIGATDFYRRQCMQNGGAALSIEVTTVTGAEALLGLFKYRAPIPGSLAMYYVGILWIPFQECRFQINVEAMEVGTTGTREAAVMLILGDAWPKPRPNTLQVVTSSKDLIEQLARTPVRRLPSDDEQYDKSFPDHPLSRVRARLGRVMATLRLDSGALSLTPFHIPVTDL